MLQQNAMACNRHPSESIQSFLCLSGSLETRATGFFGPYRNASDTGELNKKIHHGCKQNGATGH